MDEGTAKHTNNILAAMFLPQHPSCKTTNSNNYSYNPIGKSVAGKENNDIDVDEV